MKQYRYILEPYKTMKTRYRCPKCDDRDKTFVRYIDTETGDHLHPHVGRCNREGKCGYHYTPKQYFQDHNISFGTPQHKTNWPRIVKQAPKPVSFIDDEIFKASLQGYEENKFVQFLIDLFGDKIAAELVGRYFIGTSKLWKGATVFWQIDTLGKIRTGKIMLYDPFTGKRVKEPKARITFTHKAMKLPDFNLKQCLFGEHLLADKTKPVALVESEKTAVIASVYLPQFIWLAVGGLSNLNAEKLSVLRGRSVILFPDLNGFDKWSSKAKELSHITCFQFSDLLERNATEEERKNGLDLVDYLIRISFRDFILPEPEACQSVPAAQPLVESHNLETIKPKGNYYKPGQQPAESWDQEIAKLENFFTSITLPDCPLKLNQGSTINNVALFIEAHLATLRTNNGNRTFLPFLCRLRDLKQLLAVATA